MLLDFCAKSSDGRTSYESIENSCEKRFLELSAWQFLQSPSCGGTEVIPKGIGRYVAAEYVQENYVEMDLEFEDVEFSTAYGDYIASFAGEDGTELLQLLSPLWWASWQKRPSASLGICAV